MTAGGQFKRQVSSFRDTIDKNGKFPPEAGRYHLVVSLACPWAHRALILRKLKGLDKLIGEHECLDCVKVMLTWGSTLQMSLLSTLTWEVKDGRSQVSSVHATHISEAYTKLFERTGEGYEGQGKPANDFNYTKPSEAPYNFEKLRQLYFKADENYNARFTVPVIWDKKTETIVNNESSEIIRMFNHAFDDLIDEKHKGVSYYPDNLKKEIDDLNEW